MSFQKQVYKSPSTKKPLVTVVISGYKSPILPVKFSTLVKPFYYSNSPTIARYSVTTAFCPKEHAEFLKGIQTIEKNEGVESILKHDSFKVEGEYQNTGKLLIKFQSKKQIPVFIKTEDGEGAMELQDELAKGENIQVIFDILRYTKKNTAPTEYGISYKPTKIIYYPQAEGA